MTTIPKLKGLLRAIAPASAALALLAPIQTASAEGPPSNWRLYGQGSDNFNNFNGGKWRKSTHSNFKTWNVGVVGIGGNNKALQCTNNAKGEHSGGWAEGRISYWREGWFEARTKTTWLHNDIWPAWWMWKNNGTPNQDELDVFEYQSSILNHAHWKHNLNGQRGNKNQVAKKLWAVWNPGGVPAWHYRWGMDRVKSWTNWAVKSENNKNCRFFINGLFQMNGAKAWTSMHFIFSSSPHKRHLPPIGANLPNFQIDWIKSYFR